MTDDEFLETVVSACQLLPNAEAVNLGGSRARGDNRVARLEELGVTHGGIVDADYGSGLSCRDPDNISLEFFAPTI